MPKRKQPDNTAGNYLTSHVYQVQGPDPTIYDLDTAIQSWTELVNNTIPGLFNTLNYLRGIIDGL